MSIAAAGIVFAVAGDKSKSVPEKDAVERTRKSVRILDNIYKQTIVLLTDKYVHDENDFPVGSAAVILFDKISESGSHKARLIDATGELGHLSGRETSRSADDGPASS